MLLRKLRSKAKYKIMRNIEKRKTKNIKLQEKSYNGNFINKVS